MTDVPGNDPPENRFQLPLTPMVLLLVFMGVVVHLAGYLGVAPFADPLRPQNPRPSFVEYPMPNDGMPTPLLAEQALLFDTAPMFLPTPWNYVSRQDLRDYSDPALDPLFSRFPPRFLVDAGAYNEIATFRDIGIASVDAFLQPQFWDFFQGFGRGEPEPVPPYPRDGLVRVVRLPEGEVVLRTAVQPGAAGLPAERPAWNRLAFQVLVGQGGPVGRALSLRNSGAEAIDAAWRRWLRSGGLLDRLEPGYYRVEIGP